MVSPIVVPGVSCLCSGQYIKGYLHCLARELAFLTICSRVFLLITQVKQRRAWSAPGREPATRYKMVAA
jgi:hypothetical protein